MRIKSIIFVLLVCGAASLSPAGAWNPQPQPDDVEAAIYALAPCENAVRITGPNNSFSGNPAIKSNGGALVAGRGTTLYGDFEISEESTIRPFTFPGSAPSPITSPGRDEAPSTGRIGPVRIIFPEDDEVLASDPFSLGLTDMLDLWAPPSSNALDAQADGKYFALVDYTLISNGADQNDSAFSYTLTGPRVLFRDEVLDGLIFVSGHDVVIRASAIGRLGLTVISDGSIRFVSGLNSGRIRPYDNDILAYSSFSDRDCTYAHSAIDVGGASNLWEGLLMAPDGKITFSGSNNLIQGAVIGWTIDVAGGGNTFEALSDDDQEPEG